MKKTFRKKLIISLSCLLLVGGIAGLCLGLIKPGKTEFKTNTGYYISEQYEIEKGLPPAVSNTIDISELYNEDYSYNNTPIEADIININTAKDLYAFSALCDTNPAFLGYNYQLLNNINYKGFAYSFIPIAWRPNTFFTGEFNGNGYEINGLRLVEIDKSGDQTSIYDTMEYYSMFSRVGGAGGKISNLGLRDSDLLINGSVPGMIGIAPLVGLIDTNATVEFSFVSDLRDPILDESGITTDGRYRISGLAFDNRGNIHDCYTAYNIVLNYTVSEYTYFTEILMENSGIASNLFFFNRTIMSYKEDASEITIVYGEPVGKTFTITEHIGEYCDTIETLNSSVKNSNSAWYNKDSYLELNSYLQNILTPIARGINVVKENDSFLFKIENEFDYSYMFELMNLNDAFASNRMIYEIQRDLNLRNINKINYHYDRSIASTIRGKEITNGSVTLINGVKSNYPTIYNADIDIFATTDGIDAYGLFPLLSGKLMNLNIVMQDEIALNGTSPNIKAIGLATGYLNGGIIENVNTKGSISFSGAMGKYYAGNVCGAIAGDGTIKNTTAVGSITTAYSDTPNNSQVIGYMNGSAIGGVVGYITDTFGSLDTVTAKVNITSSGIKNTFDLAIGGVIGAGYTNELRYIENRGNILVSGGTTTSYKSIYVSGIVGRLLGIQSQIRGLNNQGDIEAYLNSNESYLSGILNADIMTTNKDNLTPSRLKSNGRFVFYLSEAINSGTVVKHGEAINDGYTLGINILSKNGFISELSGIYNLGYKTSNSSVRIAPIEIDMSTTKSFAPVINAISSGVNKNQEVNLQSVYNLRDINFKTSANITANALTYTGVAIGENINYYEISNEGSINLMLSHGTNSGNLYVSGLFNRLTNGYRAHNIYNAGDIVINENSNENINLNIYASGIAYSNASVISDITYNPMSNEFDDQTKGSINNAINNGNIIIKSTHISATGEMNVNQPNIKLKGNAYSAGVVAINSGIISNSFNLGNINTSLSAVKEIHTAGIAIKNDGEFAQIRDCANNGIIKGINIGNSTSTKVYSSGIVSENVSSSSTNSHNNRQVIAFTINYGEVYAFSGGSNDESITTDEMIKAGGILAYGLSNIVNTINYGNVFSSNTAGGMIGAVDSARFDTSYVATIANTLNYGIVKAINDSITVEGSPKFPTYDQIITINKDSKYIAYGQKNGPLYQAIGALIGVINFNNTNSIRIRYLINFVSSINLTAEELGTSNLTIDVSKLIDVNPLSKFATHIVTYAPLSTISDSDGNIGVFSDEFIFRQAIAGKGLDENETTDKYIGDFFQFVGFEKINKLILDKIGWRQIAYIDASKRFARDLGSVLRLIKNNMTTVDSIIGDALNSDLWIERADTEILNNLLDEIIKSGEIDNSLEEIIKYILFDTGRDAISTSFREELVNAILGFMESQGTEINYYELLNTLLYDKVLARIIANDTPEYKAVNDEIKRIINETADISSLEYIMNAYIDSIKDPNTILLDPLFSTDDKFFEAKLSLLYTLLDGYSEKSLEDLLLAVSGASESKKAKYLIYLSQNEADAKNIYRNILAYNSFDGTNSFSRAMNEALVKLNPYSVIEADGSIKLSNRISSKNITAVDNITSLALAGPVNKNYVDIWNVIKNDSMLQAYLVNKNNGILADVSSVDGVKAPGIYAKATEYTNTYQSNDSPSGLGHTVKTVKVLEANGNKRPAGSGKDEAINTRYIFTPDTQVSEATYFYGPYKSKDSNAIWYDEDKFNLNFNLHLTGSDIQTSQRYVPYFMTVDPNELKLRGVADNNMFEFLWNNATTGSNQGGQSPNQWVSPHIIDKSWSDGYDYLLIDTRNLDTIDHGFDFGFNDRTPQKELDKKQPITYQRGQIIEYDQTRVNATDQSDTEHVSYEVPRTVTLGVAGSQAISGNAQHRHPFRAHYLTAYATAGLVSGIWYQHNIWADGGKLMGAYLTAKDNEYVTINSNRYNGVRTTEYINYFIEDLVKLDGKLTKGRGNNIVSNDECAIINALMSKILETEAGKKQVLDAIARASLNGFDSNEGFAAEVLLSSLEGSSFAVNALKNIIYNDQYLLNINYNGSSLGVYLDSLITNQEYSNKEQIILRAAKDKEIFRQILVESYEKSKIAAMNPYDIPINKLNDFIYDYVRDLQAANPDITEAQINNLLNQVLDSDIATMIDLFNIPRLNQTIDGYTLDGYFELKNISEVVNGKTYNNKIVVGAGNNTIKYQSGNNDMLQIVFKGTIKVNNEKITNQAAKSHIFTVNKNSQITITPQPGCEIYEIAKGSMVEFPYSTIPANATLNKNQTSGEIANLTNKPSGITSITLSLDYTLNTGNINNILEISDDNGTIQFTPSGNTNGNLTANLTNSTGSLKFRNKYQGNRERNLEITNITITYTGTIDGIGYTYTNKDSKQSTLELNKAAGKRVLYTAGTTEKIYDLNSSQNINNISTSFTLASLASMSFNGLRSNASIIEEGFNNNYNSMSDPAKYIFNDLVIDNGTSLNLNISRPSYVIIEAMGSGSITLDNITRTTASEKKFYVYDIDNPGSYTITNSGTTISHVYIMDKEYKPTHTTGGGNDTITINGKEIINFDYSALNGYSTILEGYINQAPAGSDRYKEFIKYYPNIRESNGLTEVELRENDILALMKTLYPTMKTKQGKWVIFENPAFANDLRNIVRLLAIADHESVSPNVSALENLLKSNLLNDYRDEILRLIAGKDKNLLIDALKKIEANAKASNNSNILDIYKAALIGDSFIKDLDNYSLLDTYLKDFLDLYQGGAYQFITSNSEIDNESFISLMKIVGFNLNTEGYGIYALASSEGILNGSFIPDNVALDSMVFKYNSSLVLISDADLAQNPNLGSAWRGGTADNPNKVVADDYTTVNNKILSQMKQLIQSISTTIFTLDLLDSNGTIHYSASTLIDYKNKTITYYVPKGYIDGLSNKSLTIENQSIANLASLELVNGSLSIAKGISPNVIKVTAEDRTVVDYYSIIFEEIDISFDLAYSDGLKAKTVAANGAQLDLRVVSPSALNPGLNKLPKNMSLEGFIKVKDSNGLVVAMENSYLIPNTKDNLIINQDGSATIELVILQGLKYGSYTIEIDIFGVIASVAFTKEASSEALIKSFIYDGSEIIFDQALKHESLIDFGRAYSYIELTDINSELFYLNELVASTGATISISALKSTDSNNLMTYTVKFLVTAEDGSTNEYQHILKEKHPFKSYNPDGSESFTDYSYVTVFTDGVADTKVFDDSNDLNNVINVEFERGSEPQYSVKYSLGNFYKDGLNVSYEIIEETPGAVVNKSYAGMMVTVGNDLDAGEYRFTYRYTNSAMWDNGEYIRSYDFPELVVLKKYSKASTLDRITFLDSYQKLGKLATVINPMGAIRPGDSVDSGEISYNTIKGEGYNQKISNDEPINYAVSGVDYSLPNYTDYFTVGAISDAQLYSYAPSFKIEEHAEIYQYTTTKKLMEYGINNQVLPDGDILMNHDDLFIYVPYTSDGVNVKTFLVKVVNGSWTDVYLDSFTGVEQSIATLTENKGSFTYQGTTYNVHSSAGKADKDNYSLYMDYIGTPLDDHFWYVSYVVFSENYIHTEGGSQYLKFFHIALIDTTNTIYFDLELIAPEGFSLDSIYVTLAYNKYRKDGQSEILEGSNQISGYVIKNDNLDTPGVVEYHLNHELQVLPSGYFYFYIDLPDGYTATASITNGKVNRNENPNEVGAYLPPSSIVTQRISLQITVEENETLAEGSWGVGVGDIYTRKIKLIN